MNSFTVDANFEVTSWDEEPFDAAAGESESAVSKLTRASVRKKYSGDVDGTSAAAFVGLERIRGTIGGHPGTLVLQHVGQYRDGAAKATLTVLGGTDELGRVTGSGDFLADPAGSISLSLNT